jgi:hypothetical protein
VDLVNRLNQAREDAARIQVVQDIIVPQFDEDPQNPLDVSSSTSKRVNTSGPIQNTTFHDENSVVLDLNSPFVVDAQAPDMIYCVLCGQDQTICGGKVVLHFLKPVVETSDGNYHPLLLPVPPLIPDRYRESIVLCQSCVQRNKEERKPLREIPRESLKSHIPVPKLAQDVENLILVKTPKRAYPVSNPNDILNSIRHTPVHPSISRAFKK